MISIRNLTKYYGRTAAVLDLDLEIPRGELFGFLGPNGAGKTTTIKILSGLLRPTRGTAVIGGHDILKESSRAKAITGLIPDQPFLYEKLTGREFLFFVAGLYRMDSDEARREADRLFQLFRLEEVSEDLVESYSHGMRQKLTFASALIHSPEVLIVDEPMVGLDPRGGRLVKHLLRNFCKEGGTVFMSTHTLEVAEKLCDRVGIINEGRLAAVGTMKELQKLADGAQEKLEDIFLKLTADEEMAPLLEELD
jgi:ABC-2 type transport system ATP-binding protein